jgi:hypothetical protein
MNIMNIMPYILFISTTNLNGGSGLHIRVLTFLRINFTFNQKDGNHLAFGFRIFNFGVTLQLNIWSTKRRRW